MTDRAYLNPQALHKLFVPSGPFLHSGLLGVPQLAHATGPGLLIGSVPFALAPFDDSDPPSATFFAGSFGTAPSSDFLFFRINDSFVSTSPAKLLPKAAAAAIILSGDGPGESGGGSDALASWSSPDKGGGSALGFGFEFESAQECRTGRAWNESSE